ncbi:hypothetical protein NliqN6_0938 [Naganishia liquefaciens]|uniref:Uncharacterized protein n=1 Tax=Naganishia liquefaciens TaxID=104408 RepID=A0A8H3YE94_9TREE|nr:hypothetical protein NliqN6_0938 [Naganishia liquefaciens]
MASLGPQKNGSKTKPQKRPAQTSSQDAGMHPPKKQRIDADAAKGNGKAKVAIAGTGARADGTKNAVKGKANERERVDGKQTSAKDAEKQGEKSVDGLIAAAPAIEKPVQMTGTNTKAAEAVPKATEISTETSQNKSIGGIPAKTIPPVERNPPKSAPSRDVGTSGPREPKQRPKNAKTSKPSNKDGAIINGKQLRIARRMPPVKPVTADGQNALGRPKSASGSNPTRAIEGRDVVFVTRKTNLGSYMRRCKTLLVEDGLNQITLHALCVAIPHAVMLLYALTDILPFPRQFIHHEIQTSSVECHDEMSLVAAELQKEDAVGADKGKGKSKALAIFEEDEAGFRSRTKSGIRITIRIGKGARVSPAEHENPTAQKTGGKKARPNKAQRVAKRAQEDGERDADMGEPVGIVDEEEGMNEEAVNGPKAGAPKHQGKALMTTKSPRKGIEKADGLPGGARKQKKLAAKQKPRTNAVAMDVD